MFCLILHEKLKEDLLLSLLRRSKNNLPYDDVLKLARVDHRDQEKEVVLLKMNCLRRYGHGTPMKD